MEQLSRRLAQRIEEDFPRHSALVRDRLARLDPLIEGSRQGRERMVAAVLRLAAGRLDDLDRAIALARRDWRDLLVAAGLANEDWPRRLAVWLDPQASTPLDPIAAGRWTGPDGHRWLVRRRRLDLRVVGRLLRRPDVAVHLDEPGHDRPDPVDEGQRRLLWRVLRHDYAGPGGGASADGSGYLVHEFVDADGRILLFVRRIQ